MNRKIHSFLFALSLLLLLSFLVYPAQAQAEPPIKAEISIGFDDQCKNGNWIPIHITLSNQGGDFSGHLAISYSQAEYTLPVELAANAEKAFSTVIHLSGSSQNIVFRLIPVDEKADEIILERMRLRCSAMRLIGVVTDTPSAFTVLNALQSAKTTDLAFLSAETIPEISLGLQALDILVIANTDITRLDGAQIEAIKEWNAQGGQLVFGGGTQWQTTLAGFEDILPLKITGTRTVDIQSGFNTSDADLTLANIVLLDGVLQDDSKILFQDGGIPLVVQRPIGAGILTLLTFDPNISAFRTWENTAFFYDHILSSASGRQDFTSIKDWDAIIEATSRFQNLELPATSLVFGILIVYIVLLGPVQYLVMKRLKKLEWSWITIPIIILTFTLGLIFTGWGLRGEKPRLNHLAVVHHWAEQEEASMSGFVGIFAPRRDSYQTKIEGDFFPQPVTSQYSDTPNTEWSFIMQANSFLAETQIDNSEIMPLGFGGNLPAPQIKADLALHINSSDADLTGTIHNQSDVDLKDCVLVFPGGFEKIGSLDAGEQFDVDLPIDVLAPTNPNVNAGMGNYNYYATGTDIYLDDLFAEYRYADLQTNKQVNLLAAIFGNYELPSVGFLLIGWDDTQVPFQATLLEKEVDAEYLTAYLASFQVNIGTEEKSIVIPPVFFNWFIPESSNINYGNPYDLYIAYLESAEIYYQLGQSIPFSKVEGIIIHLKGFHQRSDFPLDVFLWDFDNNLWEKQDITDWGDFSVADPEPYIDENFTEIRVMLSENGNGGGEIEVSRIDISLIVEP
ncbi:MAG: hypothetical protein B6243_05200 [Anaerolineaceae bacterium 4572_5.2]|nr:MAG: hypothetical protein B6243_05200 [Anaerolineaceae bacterium 4572_5.2]